MNQQYDITVIVGTYNPQWEKLKATLCSIVDQKNINSQIVVSDDGSLEPLHVEIKDFFKRIGFCNYKLVRGEKNEGTVCQFYRGICAADAEYIKPISPGDLLYDDMVLSEWLAFTKETNADITFGDAVLKKKKNGKLNIVRHRHNPRNMSIYRTSSSYRDLIINYVCLEDGISGATKIVRKKVLAYYMKFLLNNVIYVEDFFIRLAVLDERKILYYPSKVIWYEYGDGGISTSGNSKWNKLMLKDNIAMDVICFDKCLKPNTEIQSWLLEIIEFKNLIHPTKCKKLARYLRHPKWLYWRIYSELFGEFSPTNVDDVFFNHCHEN